MSIQSQVETLLSELRGQGIWDHRVLEALRRVPREMFVPAELRSHAFRNIPLPIGEGQTISQPFVVALMSQALSLTGDEKVLEVGTGSGYQSAVLAELCREVVSVERIGLLARQARSRLAQLRYSNVRVYEGDGSLGWPDEAPYDGIIATAAGPCAPRALLDQLADVGRLVLPIGPHFSQELYLYQRKGEEILTTRLGSVRFVPLIGDAAWSEQEAARFPEEG